MAPLTVTDDRGTLSTARSFDLTSNELVAKRRVFDLAPDAHEHNVEIGWAGMVAGGYLNLGVAHATNAGNIAGERATAGWVRFGQWF